MPTTPEQSDFAHGKFLVFCSLQPTKSACSAAAEKVSVWRGTAPFQCISAKCGGRKRYNTLDFPSWLSANSCKSRVPTGMLLAPIGNPEPRSYAPLDTPYIFLENGTQTVKMQFYTFPQKIQNRCNLHPCEDEKLQRFLVCHKINRSFISRHPSWISRTHLCVQVSTFHTFQAT